MHQLSERLTANQIEKLHKAGITTPYQLVTFFPNSFQHILPFSQYDPRKSDQSPTRYLYTGTLQSLEIRKGKRPFFMLTLSGATIIRAYLFSVAKYTQKNLTIGGVYQFLIYQRNGFWNIEKYGVFKEHEVHQRVFEIGKADPYKEVLTVVYPKVGILQPGYFSLIHRRLQPQDYLLDLRGLIPEHQEIIPSILNTQSIHRPKNNTEFEQVKSQWISLNVYLRLVLMNYLNKQSEESFAAAGNLPLQFLQDAVSKLPFALSKSQKQTVWDLTREVCIVT